MFYFEKKTSPAINFFHHYFTADGAKSCHSGTEENNKDFQMDHWEKCKSIQLRIM